MIRTIIDRARQCQDELVAIRHDIHAHPELGLEEYRTADLVARKLQEWGIEVTMPRPKLATPIVMKSSVIANDIDQSIATQPMNAPSATITQR